MYKTKQQSSIDAKPPNRLSGAWARQAPKRRSGAARCDRWRREAIVADVALLVRDRDVPASTGLVFERLNPITGDVAARAAAASIEDANAAAAAAAAAFPAWS